jgi:uncharacterized Tic20 family protein
VSEFDNAPPPPVTVEVSSDQRTMALVAHLLGLFTGFIGALIIWLISKDDANKSFVTDQAKEALNFQITIAIALAASFVLMLVLIGALLLPVVGLFSFVFSIVAAVKANGGEYYRYPLTLRLVK